MPWIVRETSERLRGVVIENKPAIEVMQVHDEPQALHYVDPPYLPSTRDAGADYKHEMTTPEHIELLSCLKTLKGKVVLSGYASETYDAELSGWQRIEREALADKAKSRTEVIWTNFDPLPLFQACAVEKDNE